MIARCERDKPALDALLMNEGAEGTGKTNASVLEAGFVRAVTGREIHLFFRLKEMMDFAQKTEGKIIIWDEPALDSLSSDAMTTLNKDMTRLFMAIRKKRHFFIVNFTKFWKFPEYVTNERALGMFRCYSLKEIENGRFLYIKKGNLERLRQDYDKNKKKNYRKYASFHGCFPEIMDDYFDSMDIFINNKPHCTLKDYGNEKDKAIEQIGHKETQFSKKELVLWKKLNGLKKRICRVSSLTKQKLASEMGFSPTRLMEWSNIPLEDTDLLGKVGFEPTETAINTSSKVNLGNLSANEPENDD